MQEQQTQTRKVSRRFYIDHAADDRAIVRTVPVAVDRDARPTTHQVMPPDPTPIDVTQQDRRFTRLMHTAMKRAQRKHR